MAKRVNDQQVQRMEKIIGGILFFKIEFLNYDIFKEQDTIISKLEHLLGRADVQPDNGLAGSFHSSFLRNSSFQIADRRALPTDAAAPTLRFGSRTLTIKIIFL
jgi:hypothetical protein